MADEGAETPTVLPKIDFHFVLQTAASDISNQHELRADIQTIKQHFISTLCSQPLPTYENSSLL